MQRYEIEIVGGPTLVALNSGEPGWQSLMMYNDKNEIRSLERLSNSDFVFFTFIEDGITKVRKSLMSVGEVLSAKYVGRDYMARPWNLIKFRTINGPEDINFGEI